MNSCVFLGPTMPVSDARVILGASYLPPAGCGDVYRAVMDGATAIGIIDGFFHFRAAVRHKEISWALSRGVRVFGAASMGALRAVEMAASGMYGVGRIFDAFRRGDLEDDDEVAVAHLDADNGYAPVSEPMVNIRATLENAVSSSIVSRSTADNVVRSAKSLHYSNRHFRAAVELAGVDGSPRAELDRLLEWLPSGRVDLKRLDAEELLRAMVPDSQEARTMDAPFIPTEWWERLLQEINRRVLKEPNDPAIVALSGHPDELQRFRLLALLRLFALREARDRIPPEQTPVARTLSSFLAERHLNTPAALERWMSDNDLDASGMRRLINDEARLRAIMPILEEEADSYVADHLKVSGAYPTYRNGGHESE